MYLTRQATVLLGSAGVRRASTPTRKADGVGSGRQGRCAGRIADRQVVAVCLCKATLRLECLNKSTDNACSCYASIVEEASSHGSSGVRTRQLARTKETSTNVQRL